jgi:hypothetical protein
MILTSRTTQDAENFSAETPELKGKEPTGRSSKATKSRIQTVVTKGLAFQILSTARPKE